jgi:predicted SAM-dependent methyltransferase
MGTFPSRHRKTGSICFFAAKLALWLLLRRVPKEKSGRLRFIRELARRMGAGALKKATLSTYRRAVLPSKIRSRSPLWIHFGCGDIADARFLNVDARVFPHIDYVTSSAAMPAIPSGTADLIYACHVFEHVPFRKQEEVLARWRQLLKPGGKLMLSVPDFDKVAGPYHRGESTVEQIQPILMGAQDYPGNFHFAIFTKEHLSRLLTASGFSDVKEWRPDQWQNWPKDWSWEESVSLNLSAIKH